MVRADLLPSLNYLAYVFPVHFGTVGSWRGMVFFFSLEERVRKW